MAKQVAIHDLQPGMFIVGVIEQNGPVKIRKSGLVTSQEMVQGLSEMGVLSVAIDPEKTVEIEVDDSVHVSQTQFVMQANQEKASDDTDNHLAEQFNRSLFMPSLQKVPSVWQYYGSKVAVAIVVVGLGFTSGWFASSVPVMLSASHSSSAQDNSIQSNSAQETSNTPETIQPQEVVAQAATGNESGGVGQTIPGSASVDPQINAATAAPASGSNTNEYLSGNAQQSVNIPEDESQFAASATDTVNRQTTNQNVGGTPEEVASLELLKRFETAMADLERESSPEYADDGETLEYGNSGNDFNSTDVQRVDQLPARVMSRLPRMSFSAHMYSSNPGNRWVKVNGVEKGEGEWLDDKVFLEKIEPQHVILLFDGHEFSMRALSEW